MQHVSCMSCISCISYAGGVRVGRQPILFTIFVVGHGDDGVAGAGGGIHSSITGIVRYLSVFGLLFRRCCSFLGLCRVLDASWCLGVVHPTKMLW